MFKKLRNKLILINMSVTTGVIFVTFAAIYIISTRAANERPAFNDNIAFQVMGNTELSEDLRTLFDRTIHEEKQAAARNLLVTLIISGIAIELAVLLVSYLMAEEAIKPVREAYESQKIFIANASHEIKTPLAAITANLEAADIKDNKWLKNVELETAKLTALNTELLTLARTDLVTERASEDVDLKSLVESSLDSFASRAQDKDFKHHISLPPKVKINSADFIQILSILLDNAIKYSDTKIDVAITPHSLTVTNDGQTISPEALPHIFDRFYQQDKSSDGVGLGLSIAKSLADRNRWTLNVKSDKLTTFTLEF